MFSIHSLKGILVEKVRTGTQDPLYPSFFTDLVSNTDRLCHEISICLFCFRTQMMVRISPLD